MAKKTIIYRSITIIITDTRFYTLGKFYSSLDSAKRKIDRYFKMIKYIHAIYTMTISDGSNSTYYAGRHISIDTPDNEIRDKAIKDIQNFPAYKSGHAQLVSDIAVYDLRGRYIKTIPLPLGLKQNFHVNNQ